MLNRGNRLDVGGLRDYLVSLVKEFVEAPDSVRVNSEEHEFRIIYTLSVEEGDLPTMQDVQFLYRSLNHIMNKVTRANVDKAGALNDQFEVTP